MQEDIYQVNIKKNLLLKQNVAGFIRNISKSIFYPPTPNSRSTPQASYIDLTWRPKKEN